MTTSHRDSGFFTDTLAQRDPALFKEIGRAHV